MSDPGELRGATFWQQLRAMLVRNLLLKFRDSRKTITEVILPLYALTTLVILKIFLPNPNYPAIQQLRDSGNVFDYFPSDDHHVIGVLPYGNITTTLTFLDAVNDMWLQKPEDPGLYPIEWVFFDDSEDLSTTYWRIPTLVPLTIVFLSDDPLNGPLSYAIRSNPSYIVTPSTNELFSSSSVCRQTEPQWSTILEEGTTSVCPANQYTYSGFLALQTLLDFTKIRLSTNLPIQIPSIQLNIFPKDAYTANWVVAFRLVIPIYLVMALSQFITYLLILIVGEKESHIKESLKIMGLRDSVYWLGWFIIYSVFVAFLTTIVVTLLYTLGAFQHTHFLPVFLVILLYCLSIIVIAFIATPFFDNSKTAGILGSFAVNLMSMLYFSHVLVNETESSIFLWIVSLISPAGFALAMDRIILNDLTGEGVTWQNLWSGPGISTGGSMIMMLIDVILYAWLAYYLDSVVPSEHGTNRSICFCLTRRFWCNKNEIPVPQDGESAGQYEYARDVEPVPRHMRGKEAIRIVNLHKTFHTCRKPDVNAINGINLTIYEGQITAILGHNGAGKSTLVNILTGLTKPTAGTAFLFGLDIRIPSKLAMIRRMTGVCLQHDILLGYLTPREHLNLFAAIRGLSNAEIAVEVKRTLKDIGLTEVANTYVKYLSGGQKRKLSVGIAIVGDPKIIILDEPTAGVDPHSRRQMWSLLQKRKKGKVILLITHFMDEADILADRKAVMTKGRIRCCGSSLFLKSKFGIGYHLTLVVTDGFIEEPITTFIYKYIPRAKRYRLNRNELSYVLPFDDARLFGHLLFNIEEEIKSDRLKLGIFSYGISMTTLEEVFLNLENEVAEEEDEEHDEYVAPPEVGADVPNGKCEDIELNIIKVQPTNEMPLPNIDVQPRDFQIKRSISLSGVDTLYGGNNYGLYQSVKHKVLDLGGEPSQPKNSVSSKEDSISSVAENNEIERDITYSGSIGESPIPSRNVSPIPGQSVTPAIALRRRIPTPVCWRKYIIKHDCETNSVNELKLVKIDSSDGLDRPEEVPGTRNKFFKILWERLSGYDVKVVIRHGFQAMLGIRTHVLVRDIQRLYLMVVLPLVFAAIGLYLNSIQVIMPVMVSLPLDNETYDEYSSRILLYTNDQDDEDDDNNNKNRKRSISLHDFFNQIRKSVYVTLARNIDYVNLLEMSPHLGAISFESLYYANLVITLHYNDTTQHSLPILLNLLSNSFYRMIDVGTPDAGIQFDIDNTDLITSLPPTDIQIRSHPFHLTSQPQELNIGTFSSALFIGMVFVLLPVSSAIEVVSDRELRTKNQLRVNGLLISIYFLTHFIILTGLMFIVSLILLCMIYFIDTPSFNQLPALLTFAVLLFLYCPGAILCATTISYCFKRADSAQSILPNALTFLGLIPFFIVGVMDMLGIQVMSPMTLHYIFAILNPMYTPYAAVYFVDRVYVSCHLNDVCNGLRVSDYMTEEIIVMAIGSLIHIPLWAICLYIADVRDNGRKMLDAFSFIFNLVKRDRVAVNTEETNSDHAVLPGQYEDADVVRERERVKLLCKLTTENELDGVNVVGPSPVAPILLPAAASPAPTSSAATSSTLSSKTRIQTTIPVVIVKNLRKEFNETTGNCDLTCCPTDVKPKTPEHNLTKVAVKNLSFAVHPGEIFGLLGHNGAGKTTTMKIITGEIVPTYGAVKIGGYDIVTERSQAFKMMGYCPQQDALWKKVTVREHLELYGTIRGVQPRDLTNVVNIYIRGLNLGEHQHKQTQHCSGGTKRKLSYGMAMIGSPKVVLLDEPSTGMDPKSKRFIWDTIRSNFELDRGAILTTHSMEEADALCTRVGIMVKGELRCVGTPQHLKNLYGAGYTLEIKLKQMDYGLRGAGKSKSSQPSTSKYADSMDDDPQTSEDGANDPMEQRTEALREFVTGLFPNAVLEEKFADRVIYSIPQSSVNALSHCFARLEIGKVELEFEEYSFSQTTLEQVYLKFAHYNEDEDANNI